MTTNRLWLIDGHNIIFAVPSLQELQISDRREEARQALADHLERFAHARSEKVLIVFDGNEQVSNPDAPRVALLEIVYTRKTAGGADNRIIDEANRRAGQRYPVTVVTDDIHTLAVKLSPGVDRIGVGEFWLKHIEKKPAPGSKRVEGDFADVESDLLEYAAAEQASAARAALTNHAPSEPSTSKDARPTVVHTPEDRLRLKRERGRRRQQRRLKQKPKPGRRR